ncbi:MAG TPA: tyrosine-protein phosphatase [Planktothrix sp.]
MSMQCWSAGSLTSAILVALTAISVSAFPAAAAETQAVSGLPQTARNSPGVLDPADFAVAPIRDPRESLAGLNLPALRQTSALVPNLHLVTPAVIRGGQPTAQALGLLKQVGVKTIVNLRNEEVCIDEERAQARGLGLNYVSIPLDVFNHPSDKAIEQFLQVATDPTQLPIYVHCLHGQDRTGTMCAIYRIDQQGWSADRAYQEMLGYGFRSYLTPLTQTVYSFAQNRSRFRQ